MILGKWKNFWILLTPGLSATIKIKDKNSNMITELICLRKMMPKIKNAQKTAKDRKTATGLNCFWDQLSMTKV